MFRSRKIVVTYVDAESGTVLGVVEHDPRDLPESFLRPTTLHIGNDQWSVVKADPPTKERYAATRRLELTVARVFTAPADSIGYTLPTINDAIPVDEGAADGTEVVLHEDEWRQVEFIHSSQLDRILQEIRDIEQIIQDHRVGIGFDKIHIRSRISNPLHPLSLGPESLSSLKIPDPLSLRFGQHGERIKGGFAHVLTTEAILYGTAVGRRFDTLAFRGPPQSLPAELSQPLSTFVEANDLILVDWCRRLTFSKPQ